MAKYIVTWTELHATEQEANNEEEAKRKALEKEPEKTVIDVHGVTTTKKGGD